MEGRLGSSKRSIVRIPRACNPKTRSRTQASNPKTRSRTQASHPKTRSRIQTPAQKRRTAPPGAWGCQGFSRIMRSLCTVRALSILRATIALLGFAHGFPRELDARALGPVPLDHLPHVRVFRLRTARPVHHVCSQRQLHLLPRGDRIGAGTVSGTQKNEGHTNLNNPKQFRNHPKQP